MHRLALTLTRQAPRARLSAGLTTTTAATTTRVTVLAPFRAYATSAPKDAEKASAESGGSRSKDAARGRTGGGEPLDASANPPPQPKILNAAVPGAGPNKLTKEQQEEVDRHNAEFEKRADRASSAEDDKVDKSFWKGQGGHGNKNMR